MLRKKTINLKDVRLHYQLYPFGKGVGMFNFDVNHSHYVTWKKEMV